MIVRRLEVSIALEWLGKWWWGGVYCTVCNDARAYHLYTLG